MIKNLILLLSLFFGFLSAFGVYAMVIDPIVKNKIFFLICSLILIYPAFELFKQWTTYFKVTYDFHKDSFIIYGKNGHYRELNRNEIESISFDNSNSFLLKVKKNNGEIIKIMPPGLGLKLIRELERWWGRELEGKKDNLSLKDLEKYEKMFRRIKSIF